MKTCKNCSAPVEVSYCTTCGQRYLSVPFTFRSTFEWIADLVDFDKGYFWTLYVLILKPNQLITDFLNGKTRNYVNPLKFILINVSAMFILATSIEYLFPNPNKGETGADDEYLVYIMGTLYIVPIYLFNLLFFLRSKYNKLEHLIIVLYESCIFLILLIPTGIFLKIFNDEVFYIFSVLTLLTICYRSFYLKKIYGGNTFVVIIKSIVTIIASLFIIGLLLTVLADFGVAD